MTLKLEAVGTCGASQVTICFYTILYKYRYMMYNISYAITPTMTLPNRGWKISFPLKIDDFQGQTVDLTDGPSVTSEWSNST